MKFISENIIDAITEDIGSSEANFKKTTLELREEQPAVTAYIFSENFDLFTQAEKEYFLFLVLVIFKSFKKEESDLRQITENELGKQEEANWELLGDVTSKKFRERMDVFFKNYIQEDLLAFVEDSLMEEEEEMVTKVGREPMFVALKSIIDAWCDDRE